jgi:hypothetical protein
MVRPQLGETKEMEISGWLDKDKVLLLFIPPPLLSYSYSTTAALHF